jgi:cytochrome c oxidase subunit 1
VLETRLWFWFFGHPLVYFWLVHAVTLWYVLLPKVLGVEIFSETMAKVAFILYIDLLYAGRPAPLVRRPRRPPSI